MSLDYDLSKVPESVWRSKENWPRTQSLIFATMAVGIGEITEKTAPEFYARLNLWEKMHGFEPLTKPQDVINHIGLSTNVFPMESRTAWLKRIVGQQLEEAVNVASNSLKSMKNPIDG